MEIVIAGRSVEWSEPQISYEDITNRWVFMGDVSERVDYVEYLVVIGNSPSDGKFVLLPSESVEVEKGLYFIVDVSHPV